MSCIQELPNGYIYDVNREVDGSVTVRCNLKSPEEWRCWLNKFETSSCQKFIVLRTVPVVRFAFHQKLVCQHNKKNKVNAESSLRSESRNTGCKASISCKIKHVKRDTCKNDPFLKQDPPLAAILTLNLVHNHRVHCVEATRLLRVADETRHLFNKYFEDGLSPVSAIALHRSKLRREEDGVEKLANASVNPTSRMAYYLHDLWKKDRSETAADPRKKSTVNLPCNRPRLLAGNTKCNLTLVKLHGSGR